MAGLMDTINQNLQAPAAIAPPPALGQTEQVGQLLRTKLTGKAAQPETTPRQSSLGEALAQQQTRTGLQSQAGEGKIQAEQLGQSQQDIQQRQEHQQAQHEVALSTAQQEYSNKATTILDNLEASQRQLDVGQRQAQMEQAGFLIRHTNQNYINELQRQGQMNRLTDKQSFQAELAQDIMGDQMDLFKDNLKFQTAVNASDRDFQKGLSQMSSDFAMKMADLAWKQQSKQAIVSGIGGLISGGVQGYGAYTGGQDRIQEQAYQDENIKRQNSGLPILTRAQFSATQGEE